MRETVLEKVGCRMGRVLKIWGGVGCGPKSPAPHLGARFFL